jgi:hypothetical protein
MPSLSSVRTLSTCCLLVAGFFTEIAQQIHSLRARGVRSSHEARASASEARVFRKSSGNAWTTPPEIAFLVIVIRLSYYTIARSRKDCRSECASSMCLSSPMPNVQQWCAHVHLWGNSACYGWRCCSTFGAKNTRPEGQICSLPPKSRILTRRAQHPPWERASPCSREPQVAGQNVVSAARYLVARTNLPQDRCKVAW